MARIDKIRTYLINVLDEMQHDFQTLNANFLSSEPDNYSLNRIPTEETTVIDILGNRVCRDVYNLLNREEYSSNTADNLSNIGFWEAFEDKIYSNNEQGVLPDIEGIKSIRCLNSGSLQIADTQTCVMSIQIEITYDK